MDWDAAFLADQTPWERPDLHPAFADWADLVEGSLLIPGAGRAPEGLAFARRGVKVTLADLSPAAMSTQGAQFARAGQSGTMHVGDIFEYAPDTPFDSIWEQTCLCAISPKLRMQYAEAAWRWLKPGGRLFALFMQTHGWRGRLTSLAMVASGRRGPPYHCPLPEMQALFSAERWIWSQDGGEYAHPRGWVEAGRVLVRR